MSTRTAHRHLERHTLPCRCGVEREPEHSVGNRIDKTLAEDRPVRHRARGAVLALPPGQWSTASGSLLHRPPLGVLVMRASFGPYAEGTAPAMHGSAIPL